MIRTTFVSALALVACGDDDTTSSHVGGAGAGAVTTSSNRASVGTGGGPVAAGRTGSTSSGVTQTLNDAQIASVSITANTGEVEQNGVGVMRAMSPEVRSFAEDMVAMHMAAAIREQALAMSMMITPADNPVRQMLQSNSMQIVGMLQGADASTFDALYLNSQVDVHAQVLTLIDQTLMPQAQAQPLKDELASMRTTVMQHLERARALAGAKR